MTQHLIIKSSLKNLVKDKGFHMGAEFYEEVNKEMTRVVTKALIRAGENQRKTVYGKDV